MNQNNNRKKNMKLFNFILTVLKWIFLTIIILILEVFTPLCVVILPMYIYRFIVKCAGKIFKPNFGEILSGLSAVNGSDDILTRPTYTILLYCFVLGRLDLKEHQDLWMDKVLNVRLRNGKLKYPELRQFVSPWLGFNFWEQDKNFDIGNHVRMFDSPWKISENETLDEGFIARIGHRLLKKPFNHGQSPWEILLLYNAKTTTNHIYEKLDGEETLVFIRYHHALADGFAITQLLSNVSTGRWYEDPKASFKFPMWKKIICMVLHPFISTAVAITEGHKYADNNEWTKKSKTPTNIVNHAYTSSIPIERIKTIKNSLGVSFHAVLFAAFTSAIRNYMIETKTKVPKHCHVGIPLPIPGRPDRLTNHVTGGFLKLPTGISSPLKRLKAVEADIVKVRRSLAARMVGMFGQIYLGAMCTCIIKQLRKVGMGTASLSIFPGPPDGLTYITGEPILTLGTVLDFAVADQAIMIGGVSYAGFLRIFMGVDESVIPNKEALKMFIAKFEEEFDVLTKEMT